MQVYTDNFYFLQRFGVKAHQCGWEASRLTNGLVISKALSPWKGKTRCYPVPGSEQSWIRVQDEIGVDSGVPRYSRFFAGITLL